MFEPISQIKTILSNSRYLLLAGTMLSTLAVPQWSAASDTPSARAGTIILAQNAPGESPDPRQKVDPKAKQAPQPKGGQPQPKQNVPQQGQPQPRQVPPPPPAAPPQPRQVQPPPPQSAPPPPRQVQPPPQQGQPPIQRSQPKQPQQQQQQQGNQPPPRQQQPVQVQPRDAEPKALPKGPQQKQAPKGPPPQPPQQVQPQPGMKQAPQPQQGQPQQGQPQQGQPRQQQGQPQPAQPQPRQVQPQPGQPQPGQPPQPQQQGQPQPGQPQQQPGQPQPGQPGQPPQPQQQGQPQPGQPPQGVQPQGQQPAQVQPGGALPKAPPTGQPRDPQQQQFQQQQGIGNVDQLRLQRRERVETGGRTVIEEPGRRQIVRDRGGQVFIRHDESERFRQFEGARVERRGAENYTIIRRPGGVEIITVTDANGRLLRRIRRGPDRREIVLIDNRPRRGGSGFFLNIAPPVVTMPRERYIVEMDEARPELLYETLEAPPLVRVERPYSLDEIRYNVALRDRMRRVDVNTITFETGSWEVAPDQAPRLQAIADAIMRVTSRNPNEVFMIEGHTDAVGTDEDNLSLSDRRAEAVANILTSNFQIPPENLVTQGYGEQNLKVQTDGPSRENRRVTVRRITPLLKGANR